MEPEYDHLRRHIRDMIILWVLQHQSYNKEMIMNELVQNIGVQLEAKEIN